MSDVPAEVIPINSHSHRDQAGMLQIWRRSAPARSAAPRSLPWYTKLWRTGRFGVLRDAEEMRCLPVAYLSSSPMPEVIGRAPTICCTLATSRSGFHQASGLQDLNFVAVIWLPEGRLLATIRPSIV